MVEVSRCGEAMLPLPSLREAPKPDVARVPQPHTPVLLSPSTHAIAPWPKWMTGTCTCGRVRGRPRIYADKVAAAAARKERRKLGA